MRRTALIIPTVAVAGLALLAGCSSGGDSCLEGSWEPVDMSQFGVEAIEEAGGSFDVAMKFDDGTISMDVTANVPASDDTEETSMEMSYRGKYSVSGDKIKVSDVTGSTMLNGEEQDGDGGLDEGESSYTCSGDKLTIDDEEFTKK